MNYYNLKNVLTQSPEKLKLAILAVLGIAAGVRGWDPDLLETVGVGFAIERVLDLFYAAPVKDAAEERKALEGIELGRQLTTMENPGVVIPLVDNSGAEQPVIQTEPVVPGIVGQ